MGAYDMNSGMLPRTMGELVTGCRPIDGVSDDLANIVAIVHGIGLVAGPEVKDLALSALITAAASEDLAAFKPTDKDQIVGRRDVEVLAVHFRFGVFRCTPANRHRSDARDRPPKCALFRRLLST